MKLNAFSAPYLVWMVVFIVVPLLMVVYFAFTNDSGEFTIEDITKASFKEVFFSDTNFEDRWYKAKLQFITFDEKTEKEKRSNVVYLVNAASLYGAVRNVDDMMCGSMIDYSSIAVQETPIIDVFEYKSDKV